MLFNIKHGRNIVIYSISFPKPEDNRVDKSDSLARLLKDNPDIYQLFEAYEEIERTYQAALIAIGEVETIKLTVANSAELTLSFNDSQNTADN